MSKDLDDLASSFGAAFNVTNKINDPNKPHPRYSQYKSKGDFGTQEKRRQQTLENQKKRRDDFLSVARDIANGIIEDEDETFDEDAVEKMEVEQKHKLRKSFKNQLMESEWLVDVPEDLKTNYLMIPVPVGRRAFLVAGYGTTSHYSRSGIYVNSFPSLLPGGSRKTDKGGNITFLDCIHVQHERTFYILDVMIWNDFNFYECETDCRRFMLKSRFDETPELAFKSRINPFVFKLLPSYDCDETLSETLKSKLDFHPNPLDGLLFYNKKVHYLPGSTPLVGWLKGYMVPEMLGIQVSNELMGQKPNAYANMTNYISEYNAQRDQLKSKKTPEKSNEMMQ